MQAYEEGKADQPNKDFLIISLDLISAMVQSLEVKAIPLLNEPQFSFFSLLSACNRDSTIEVRTSSFALMGDIAMCAFEALEPQLPHLIPDIIRGMDPIHAPDFSSSNNNATWAAGEIALKFSIYIIILENGMDPWIQPLLSKLIPTILNRSAQLSLVENTAITLGRLGLCSPALVAPHLGHFCRPFMDALVRINDNPEKTSAFIGFCRLCLVNPNALLPHFHQFCDASTRSNVPELINAFQEVLSMFVSVLGERWGPMKASFQPLLQQKLVEKYGI